MRLQDYINEESIHLDMDVADKRGFFQEALQILRSAGKVSDPQQVLEDLEIREGIMSTGVGLGVAIPHAQSAGVERLDLSLWRPRKALDFHAVDGQPVDIIFMILGPKSSGSEHVKILAKISRMLHGEDFREKLRQASTPAEVLEVIRSFDAS